MPHGVLLGRDEVQDRDHQHGDGLIEVDQFLHLRRGQHLGRASDVRVHDVRVRIVGEQRGTVRHGDRITVHVHHPGSRASRLRHLVDVALGRDARSEVDELPHPGVDQETHGPPEKGAVGPRQGPHLRVDGRERRQRLPVYGEIVLAAQHCVVHPGNARLVRVDTLRQTFAT